VTDDELREQLALHAVGALTDAERTELEDVLRARPDLQAELDELRDVARLLADAVPASPPPALRANILDAIAGTPQLPRQTAPVPAAAPAPEAPVAPVVPIGAGRRRNRFVAVGAVAAAVVAIVVGVLVVSPWSGGDTDPVAAVVDAADAVEIAMPGTGEAGSLPGVTIVHSPSEDAAVLLADQVPVPEDDRVYELWAIRDGTPERFATFRPDDSGRLSVYAPGLDPASAEVWAITEEPAGGSDTPTLPILNATA
jgi:anti-sigma-K factor RskA